MTTYELLDDLYGYNRWANLQIAKRCDGLANTQWDAKRDLSFGSLRAILFHLLTAERIWMERWNGMPWRPFPKDPDGMTIEEFTAGLAEVAAQRRSLIGIHRASRWREPVTYLDSKKSEHTHPLFIQLLHVANHGVHHRAQALNILKQYGRTMPAGLDYSFYRLAASKLPQLPESVVQLREKGFDVATLETDDPIYDPTLIDTLYRYHDWATNEVLSMCDTVEVAALDRDFQMGKGSIRKTLLHLIDVDRWWLDTWQDQATQFSSSAIETPLSAIRETWSTITKQRDTYFNTIDKQAATQLVSIAPGGIQTSFHLGESMVQVALHGTHHRAQLVNMIRRGGGRVRDIDLPYCPLLSRP